MSDFNPGFPTLPQFPDDQWDKLIQEKSTQPEFPSLKKIFVGNLPKSLDTVSVLDELFVQYGAIKRILTRSLTTDGYAFVEYHSQSSATQAIQNLHNKLKFQGCSRPIQVNYALPKGYIPIKSKKLFIGQTGKLSFDQLRQLLERIGPIYEMAQITDQLGSPKRCAFVTYVLPDDAERCISKFNDAIIGDSTLPLIVKYAKSCDNSSCFCE